MTFNSLSYFIFLPTVYLFFHFLPDRWRWVLLLIASYVFYASFNAPYLLAALFVLTVISYLCGLRIAALTNDAARKRWFWSGTSACVALLVLLKYFSLLEANANSMFGVNSPFAATLVTVGVSYYSFQAISYMTDIYLEIQKPEQHFGHYALFMAFFPKLLQGPIERAENLLPQFKKSHRFNYDAMRSGMLLFYWGLLKKVAVADRLAIYVDQIYSNVHAYTGLPLLLGTYAYALQIWFDFSGYTDMARGAARMFGINLVENFDSPYMATSIADFWRRWHISFSRWILDYIFKPLQMSWRSWGKTGTAAALVMTFLVSGVWHGASGGFIIWGLLHGTFLATSIFYRPYQKKLYLMLGLEKSSWVTWWQRFVTFNLVSFGWIFFRAGYVKGIYIISNLFDFRAMFSAGTIKDYVIRNVLLDANGYNFTVFLLLVLLMMRVGYLFDSQYFNKLHYVFRYFLYVSLILICLNLGAPNMPKCIYLAF